MYARDKTVLTIVVVVGVPRLPNQFPVLACSRTEALVLTLAIV